MDDTRYVYWTDTADSPGTTFVTVRSGSSPTIGSKIDLYDYNLMVSSDTPATEQGQVYSFPPDQMLTVEAQRPARGGVQDPNPPWVFNFRASTDSSVQVSQITDP
jgi:hypothetical protein